MRQYETAIRIAQVHHLADERKYKKALTVIQTLDMRQVRNVSDLKVFAEVFIRTEQFDAAKTVYLRIYKKSRTRRILYRLIYLAIRTNELGEAEKYYAEFLRMNPNERDALIVRYRIDKAAGVPVGQLIDTLQRLKEEEYIEEWAYELAKLYQQAGRYEECQEECEDIKLWFGTGEIVERAKLLLEHIQERDPMPFLDDKDYTDLIPREEPNPEDTGSLPDLSEYLESDNEKEMKLLKKVDPAKFEEIKAETVSNLEEDSQEEILSQIRETAPEDFSRETEKVSVSEGSTPGAAGTETAAASAIASAIAEADAVISTEGAVTAAAETVVTGEAAAAGTVTAAAETAATAATVEMRTGAEGPSIEKSGMAAEEEAAVSVQEAATKKTEPAIKTGEGKIEIDPSGFSPISQSGTGITQDLAKEISVIYEAERQAQLKEKSATVMREIPNVANQVVERLTEAASQSETKAYTPLVSDGDVREEDTGEATVVIPSMSGTGKVEGAFEKLPEDETESGEQGDMAPEQKKQSSDLDAELKLLRALEEELQEAEEKAEKALVAGGHEEIQRAKAENGIVPAEETVTPVTAAEVIAAVDANIKNSAAQKGAMPVAETAATMEMADAVVPSGAASGAAAGVTATPGTAPGTAAGIAAPGMASGVASGVTAASGATAAASEVAASGVTAAPGATAAVPEAPAAGMTAAPGSVVATPGVTPEASAAGMATAPAASGTGMTAAPGAAAPRTVSGTASGVAASGVTAAPGVAPGTVTGTTAATAPETGSTAEEANATPTATPGAKQEGASVSREQKKASATGEVLPEKDLPTTRALHRSFADILILIGGEMDPSHFVLMGDGKDRILGIAKKISVVMKETGYLSSGRIAHIGASQLNQMDIAQFKKQLKGNCLLITNAAELLFPTITKVFSVMDEFYGDFTVILSDEGSTLDQLFRFVPALSRRFKYVIDISEYTEQDYR